MHQTEFKCHRARIIKAFKVESSKFALLCFRVTAATFMSSVHHQLFVQEKYQRVLLSSASGWRKTLYHSDSMIQVNSSSRVCAASCKRPAVLGNFSRVKLFFLMSFIPSPKMSLCLCSLFLSWRLNLPLQRQRLFCVVTRRKESLKSNPGCSADRPRPRFPELFLFPFRLLCQTFVLGSRWIESAARSFLTNTRGDWTEEHQHNVNYKNVSD